LTSKDQPNEFKKFNLSIVDIIFAVLVGYLFEQYREVSSIINLLFFILTLFWCLYYYYNYREWFGNLELKEITKKRQVCTMLIDVILLFIGFQMVNVFYRDIPLYIFWFSLMFLFSGIWEILQMIYEKKIFEKENYYFTHCIIELGIFTILFLLFWFCNQILNEIQFFLILIIIVAIEFIIFCFLHLHE
jgi:hypothetical protein